MTQALYNDHVFGILIDAYTAGSNRDILDDPLLHVASLIEYPRSFGIVLSGGLANVDKEVLDYVKTNEGNILEVLERFTQKLKVFTHYGSIRLILNFRPRNFECSFSFVQKNTQGTTINHFL